MVQNLLLPVKDAKEKILKTIKTTDTTILPVQNAHKYVLAEDLFAQVDLPPFPNSSMDGYAVRSADTQSADQTSPVELSVLEDIPAGYHPQKELSTGQASRIMTGAEIPPGANAVIPVEETNFAANFDQAELPEKVLIYKKANIGDYIRPKGQDIQKGIKIFSKNHFLRPQDLGSISGSGIANISVFKKPKIALISSGDEICPPGQVLQPGQIYDINTVSIQTLLVGFGAEVINLGIAKDTKESVEELLEEAVKLKADMIVSTAGVSVGVYDHIRKVILKNGNLNFWRVNIRPGKPLVFGDYRSIPFFGVPGNPVSAFVISLVFLKPVIEKMSGLSVKEPVYQQAILDEEIKSDGRESYLRGIVTIQDQYPHAKLTGHQGSGNIFSLVSANALLVIPVGVKSLPKGSMVDFISL